MFLTRDGEAILETQAKLRDLVAQRRGAPRHMHRQLDRAIDRSMQKLKALWAAEARICDRMIGDLANRRAIARRLSA
jgi:hypothetical protein